MASVDNLSVNAFKSVVDIDLIGSFITAKATLPHLVESAQRAQNGTYSSLNSLGPLYQLPFP